jgi:3-oxoacyl-[acyl-carrier protein] reductase
VTESASAASGRRRTALVLGGSGTVGAEVVRALVRAGVRTAFTYLRGQQRAAALAAEVDARALPVDLAEPAAIEGLFERLAAEGATPDVLVHCAAVSRSAKLAELGVADWDGAMAVNARSAFLAVRALAPRLDGGGDVVLLGGLDRTQSVPAPAVYAATQGALSALVMALGKELGPAGIRVNMLAVGILGEGLTRDLDPKVLADYRTFSALRRTGSAAEVAAAVVWLALENSYMTGRVVTANGGL